MSQSITPEDAFWLLVEASNAHRPAPHRETRGRCPAHGDHDYGLSFRIADSGNLLAHCFAQECSIDRIADAIGVTRRAFFTGGGARSAVTVMDWDELPILELFKLIPFGYDFDTQVECVMRSLEFDLDYAVTPMKEVAKTETTMLVGIWLDPGYTPESGNWWDWHDKVTRYLFELNRDTRTSPLQQRQIGLI